MSTADDLSSMVAAIPFADKLGLRLTRAEPDMVRAVLPWSNDNCTSFAALHGGAIMALADTVGAVCAFLNLPPGASTSTIESKTNFFRGVRSGDVAAVSCPLHVGRTTIVVRTDLTDDRGKSVATVTQTQIVLSPAP
jgi:uncharacterized protein (TIGR00369 family)